MKTKRQIGFTLIELLIAVTVLAIIFTMAYSSLNSVLKTHELLSKQQEQFKQLSQIINQLQKEIRHIVPRPIHDKYNSLLPALKLDSSNEVIFSFSRAGIPNPSGLQKNSLQRIDYIFSKQVLKKHIWLTVDSNNIDDYKEEIIAETSNQSITLNQFKIELLGFDGMWYQQWPVNRTDPIDSLPKAVKFSLNSKETGEIIRIVELPL